MKKNKLAKALNLVDDDWLEEAAPCIKKEKKKKSVWRMATVACLGALLLACSLWLFIPFNTDLPDVSQYEGSEYYDIILKLNTVTYVRPAFKNNFDKYVLNVFRGATGKDDSANESGASDAQNSARYEETTDNQVQGVVEADRIKRSSTHIFYLDNDTLTVYSVAGENSAKVGAYKIPIYADTRFASYYDEWEFYLSQDCQTITVIAPYYDYNARAAYVDVVSLNAADPAAICESGRITVSGYYLSSRMVDGEMLLLTQFYVGNNPDFSKEKNYLPQINTGNGFECLPAKDIISPAVLNSSRYTVVCKLSEDSLALRDSAAFLSYSTEVYVSTEDLFVTRPYSENVQKDGGIYDCAMTEISRMSYGGDTLEYKGGICVSGTVKDQYSMDVYENVLRVVTATEERLRSTYESGDTISDTIFQSNTSADLYCISLTEWRVIADVIGFAPQGETVASVRFDGTSAYVCTAVVATVTDPVFFFDLSDLNNITCKDTGVISGYSTSLVNFGDGYLLGIGVGDDNWETLKIEIYEESDLGVVSVCKYELKNVSYSEKYKSYFIDRENRLIGLGISCWGQDESDSYDGYLLLHFDDFALREVFKEELNGTNEGKRGLLIDECFYLFGENDFVVKPFA